jgi:hypothetical protein
MTDNPPLPEPAADAAAPADAEAPAASATPAAPRRSRPMLERAGMALIALVMALLFALVGVASFVSGEAFLGVMGVIGCLMVLWAGGSTVLRG